MASLALSQLATLPFPRWSFTCPSFNFVRIKDLRLRSDWEGIAAASRKKVVTSSEGVPGDGEVAIKRKTTTRKSAKGPTTRTRKEPSKDSSEDGPTSNKEYESTNVVPASSKPSRGRRKKAAPASNHSVAVILDEKISTRTEKVEEADDDDVALDQSSEYESDISDSKEYSLADDESDSDLGLDKDDAEDISHTYDWPPLICCFGAAQHYFLPSGRPANRLLDYEIHNRVRDSFWEPEKFVRAPGGSAGSVAIALARLGGKVAFMGKLGNDNFGQAVLYSMNKMKVQTRAVKLDNRRATAVSKLKIAKRGNLRATCSKPAAEDSLADSDINIDVLREAKMFYFSTHSLLEQNTRAATRRALKISKKLGGVIFYDLNLPFPLWQSSEETKLFIQQWWNMANIIEVTKQELEFLCGIKPAEEFNTRNNARSKFVHYGPEVVAPLWHKNLQILFVTNGTSKIHYYTSEHDGCVNGMEDAPLTPFTSDMSASGDGIVAAIMRKLSLQPDLMTDKGYLLHTIKYAIDSGVIDQWLQARQLGYPPTDGTKAVPDRNGLQSISEKEYRTLGPQI